MKTLSQNVSAPGHIRTGYIRIEARSCTDQIGRKHNRKKREDVSERDTETSVGMEKQNRKEILY
jgi:hypothetical protein